MGCYFSQEKRTWKSQRAAELDTYKTYLWKNNICTFPFCFSFTKKDSGAADHRNIYGTQNYCHPKLPFPVFVDVVMLAGEKGTGILKRCNTNTVACGGSFIKSLRVPFQRLPN